MTALALVHLPAMGCFVSETPGSQRTRCWQSPICRPLGTESVFSMGFLSGWCPARASRAQEAGAGAGRPCLGTAQQAEKSRISPPGPQQAIPFLDSI